MRSDVVLELGKRRAIDLRFDLNMIERSRFNLMSLIWLIPTALLIWHALNRMGWDLNNWRDILTVEFAVLLILLLVPFYLVFSPEQVKGGPMPLVPGWVVRLTRDGVEWRFNLFDPVDFYWSDVEMVALQHKGWSKSPYFVVYTRTPYIPVIALPQYRRELLSIKGAFGDKAAAAIELKRLTVKEKFFKNALEEMLRGSGFQVFTEGKDTFYRRPGPLRGDIQRGRPSFGGRPR